MGLFAAGLALLKLHEGDNGLFGWSCSHRHVEVIFEHNDVGLGRVCDSMVCSSVLTFFLSLAPECACEPCLGIPN